MSDTENTLLIIKPIFMKKKNQILMLLQSCGFLTAHRKMVTFFPEQAAEFYKDLEHTDPFYAIKIMTLTGGPSECIILDKQNAVKDLIHIIHFSSCGNLFIDPKSKNTVHASSSITSARKEIKYIFSNVILQPSRNVFFGAYFDKKNLITVLAEGTLKGCQNDAGNPRLFLSKWLSRHGDIDDHNFS